MMTGMISKESGTNGGLLKKGGTVWYSIFQQKYGVGLHMISHPQIRKGVLTYELHTIFGHCREGREEKNAD